MTVDIKRSLYLVVPVEMSDGSKAYIHAQPISKEVYKEHFLVIGQTYSRMFSEGLSFATGPRTALYLLELVATERKIWDGENGVKNTLLNEIVRLCNLVYAEPGKGYKTIPLEVAIERELVDMDEAIDEIVFFTCVACINKKGQVARIMSMVAGLWGNSITSLPLTEWTDSLATLKAAASTGEKPTTSSPTHSTPPAQPDSPNSFDIPV